MSGFERNKQFDLDFYKSTDDGYSTVSGDMNADVTKLYKKYLQKKATKPESIVNDPEVSLMLDLEASLRVGRFVLKHM